MKHLQDVLDRKNYQRLVKEFGGRRIWVPKTGNIGHRDRRFFRDRDRMIRRMLRRGAAIDRVARQFDISIKRVYGVAGGKAGAPRSRKRRRKRGL